MTMRRAIVGLAALVLATSASAAPPGSPWGEKYFPNVLLQTQDGKTVRFYDDLIRDKHVVLTFIYTRCKKMCGPMTANLARVQRELGDRVGKDIFFYSLSLDPENDSPEALKQYAAAYKAKPGWTFLTGKKEDIELLRRKFGDISSIESHSVNINIGNDKAGTWWSTIALDNPKYLATVIGDWMDPGAAGRPTTHSYLEAPRVVEKPSRGQEVFRQHCAMCHLSNGESVGPDLAGVVQRRGRDWVVEWMRSPEKMVARKDPVAVKIVERASGVVMPDVELGSADLAEVLRFLEGPGAAARAPPGQQGARAVARASE
jgi:protein SCO1/2